MWGLPPEEADRLTSRPTTGTTPPRGGREWPADSHHVSPKQGAIHLKEQRMEIGLHNPQLAYNGDSE